MNFNDTGIAVKTCHIVVQRIELMRGSGLAVVDARLDCGGTLTNTAPTSIDDSLPAKVRQSINAPGKHVIGFTGFFRDTWARTHGHWLLKKSIVKRDPTGSIDGHVIPPYYRVSK